uniref:Secreted protein n=1 Tax=Arundo donax TaxID=35708 RepID=A0A0A9E5G2_ARUDO
MTPPLLAGPWPRRAPAMLLHLLLSSLPLLAPASSCHRLRPSPPPLAFSTVTFRWSLSDLVVGNEPLAPPIALLPSFLLRLERRRL